LEHSPDPRAEALSAATPGPETGNNSAASGASAAAESAATPDVSDQPSTSPATCSAASTPEAPRARTPAALESKVRARLEILTRLLGDDALGVVAPVRRGLLAAGRRAVPALRRAARAPEARRRVRARLLLAELERKQVLRRIAGYALRPDLDLERGLFLLARLDRSAIDRRPYVKALDAMGAAVRARVAAAADSPSAPLALAQYLGDELGFVGSDADFNHPDHVHLHRALEKKRGMPLTLVAIYLLVARRAGLRAAPIALPGRVLLRLYAGPRSLILDPFLGGKARTRQDCVNYLAKHGLVPRPQWFADAGDGALFQRQILNLMGSHQARGRAREAAELQAIVAAVNRQRARRRANP
jgi:regulator of sirC expression with transglutaminase-like and TPR domain